jgi:hypothetical protein
MGSNEWGIILATVGVIVGVVLEGWEHWDDFRKKGCKPIVPKLGFAILVISLAVEIVFDARLARESADTDLRAARLQQALAWRTLEPGCANAAIPALFAFKNEPCTVEGQTEDLEAVFFSFDINRL